MTLDNSLAHSVEPAEVEARDVDLTLDLTRRATEIGAKRLLLAQMNWERLFSSASPPGAPTATVARETLTRAAIRRKEAARRAFRSGVSGLARAIRAVPSST